MNELDQLDSIFTENRNRLNDIIKQFQFISKFEFTLNKDMVYTQGDLINYPGIYKIDIKIPENVELNDWIDKFEKQWGHEDYQRHFVPNIKKKRRNAFHLDITTWYPLYIGKSINISKRIRDHIHFKLSRTTTALKLLERVNIYGNEFRISTIEIQVKNYDLIVSEFENYFREEINPIIGRK